jgi:hypothetical protein
MKFKVVTPPIALQQHTPETCEKYNSVQSIIPVMKDVTKTVTTERQGGSGMPQRGILMKGLESVQNPSDFLEAGFGRPPVPPIALTRYLYIKEEVLASLALSIFEKQKDEALFWAYELFNSGFQECAMEFLIAVYREMFKADNPRLENFLNARYDEWTADRTLTHILGTMVINLCDLTRKFNVEGFITQKFPPPTKTKDSAFYIMFSEDAAKKYDTVLDEAPRLTLEKACIYSARKNANAVFKCGHVDLSADQLKDMLFYKWIYYASFSPVWMDRILQYGGTVDHDTTSVEFLEPDDFYSVYGFEPDEQKPDVLQKLMGCGEKQMTEREFIEKY